MDSNSNVNTNTKPKFLFPERPGEICINDKFKWTLDGVEIQPRQMVDFKIGGHWIPGVVVNPECGLVWSSWLKSLRKHFGDHVGLYGGRKAFTDLMLERGHSLEAISQWMGHSTIGRTWRTYRDRRGVKFSLP